MPNITDAKYQEHIDRANELSQFNAHYILIDRKWWMVLDRYWIPANRTAVVYKWYPFNNVH